MPAFAHTDSDPANGEAPRYGAPVSAQQPNIAQMLYMT